VANEIRRVRPGLGGKARPSGAFGKREEVKKEDQESAKLQFRVLVKGRGDPCLFCFDREVEESA